MMHSENLPKNSQRKRKMNDFRNQLKNLHIKKITADSGKWVSLPEISQQASRLGDSPNETEKIFKAKYQIIEKIGEGSSAIVYRCKHHKSGESYALKLASYEPDQIHQLKEIFQSILELNHPCIIKYKAFYVCSHSNKAYLVMEDFGFPDLTIIQMKDEIEIRNLAQKLLEVVDYLHLNGICHRDIKPGNILYNPKTKEIRLIDFNISKRTRLSKSSMINQEMLTPTGTPHYRAPETYAGSLYQENVDEWSIGACLYQIITKNHPFKFCNHMEHPSCFCNYQYCWKNLFTEKVWSKFSPHCKNLISQLLKPAHERITACKALKHIWFATNLDSGHQIPFQTKNMVNRLSFQNRNYRFLEEYIEMAGFSKCLKSRHSLKKNHSSIQLKNDEEPINSIRRKIIRSKLLRAETGKTNQSDNQSFLLDSEDETNCEDISIKKSILNDQSPNSLEDSLLLRRKQRKFTS